jgi:hypothetical protein
VDLNKLLSILGKKFIGEVVYDYFIIIRRRTNGSKETIHLLLHEGVGAQIYIMIFSLHLQLGLK